MNEEILKISALCYQCGECTGACPLRRVSKFSPRSFVYNLNENVLDTGEDEQWNCLICDNCYIICPQGVDFPALMLNLRTEECAKPNEDILAHRIFSEITTFMTFFDKGVSTDFKGESDEASDYSSSKP